MFEIYFIFACVVGMVSGYVFLKDSDITFVEVLLCGLITVLCGLVWPLIVIGSTVGAIVLGVRFLARKNK